ncbi:hypothetical protein [Roseisolibacter agri]|uniref:VanZ like family protein n=1 Tax=Roseisolibacter agri TaxID=2014610 RepID=A0AA37QF93_9BACT|nr:hypothetical protein [Roseisolibacter agri]GLC24653.1 hypothetical protein rosag_11660 [Roseisolibacter agri]
MVVPPHRLARTLVVALAGVALVAFAAIVVAADRRALPTAIQRLYAWPGGDKVGHVVLLAALAFVCDLALQGRIVRLGAWTLSLAGVLVAVGITLEEASQALFPGRTLSVADLACSYLGVYLGVRAARRLAGALAMRRSSVQAVLLLASATLAPTPADAQRPAPAGVVGRSATLAPMTDAPLLHAPTPRRPPAWPYVLGGAVLGGAAMAGGLALALRDGESLAHPIAYVPAVAGAAALGAGGGYLVYRLRF